MLWIKKAWFTSSMVFSCTLEALLFQPLLFWLSHRLQGPGNEGMMNQWSLGINLAKVSFYLYIIVLEVVESSTCFFLYLSMWLNKSLMHRGSFYSDTHILGCMFFNLDQVYKSLTLRHKDLYFYRTKLLNSSDYSHLHRCSRDCTDLL